MSCRNPLKSLVILIDEKERLQMTIKYDKETDAIYVVLLEDKVIESEETSKDSLVDYNENIGWRY